MRRNLQTEITAYSGTLRRLRDEIQTVQQQRQSYAEKCEEATQVRLSIRVTGRLDARVSSMRAGP